MPGQPPSSPLSAHPDGVVVEVWVVPRAARTEVAGLHDGAVRVRVAAAPAGGRANRAAGQLLVRLLGGKGHRVLAGTRARRKRILVEGVGLSDAASSLFGE